MTAATQPSTARRKSWSRWNEHRAPSEYELVTHDLHWHYKPGTPPWELAPDHIWNRFYVQFRDNSPLRCSDWNIFRDPDRLTYRSYVHMQDMAENVIDGVIDAYEAQDVYRSHSPVWLDALQKAYTPFRYAGHALMMTACYLMHMAPSSYVSNVLAFQAADELRRVQRVAYQTRQLQLAHQITIGADRSRWEDQESWQGLRRAIEELLVVRDWGEAFARLNLLTKPAVDTAFNVCLAEAAEAAGDGLTAMMHRNLQLDSARSLRWTVELTRALIADTPANQGVLSEWLAASEEATVAAAAKAFEPLASVGGHGAHAVEARIRSSLQAAWTESKLPAELPAGG